MMSQDYADLVKRLRERQESLSTLARFDSHSESAEYLRVQATLDAEAASAISALTQKLEERDRVAVEAVEFIGVMRDEMAMAGWPPGDRAVLLANFREMLKQSCLSRADAAEDTNG